MFAAVTVAIVNPDPSRAGAGVPGIGFYTFGAVSPVQGVAMHHESTFTLAFIVVDA